MKLDRFLGRTHKFKTRRTENHVMFSMILTIEHHTLFTNHITPNLKDVALKNPAL